MGFIKISFLVLLLAAVIYNIARFFNGHLKPQTEGRFHPVFRDLAVGFRSLFEDGLEEGAAVAVYYKGEYIVDMWGGFADEVIEQRWKEDTITRVYSCTKGVAGVTAALMAERGWLDYKKLVSFYWPGFAKNGKDNITVEMLLSHQAGLATLTDTVSMLTIKSNPEKVEKLLEEQRPIWPPGSEHGYHTMTYGLYVDTLLKKADPQKRNISQIFREEIALPLGIDFFIGLPKSENYRMARFHNIPLWKQIFRFNIAAWPELRSLLYDLFIDTNSLLKKTLTPIKEYNDILDNPDLREVPFSTNSGFGSARGLAKLMGLLARKDGLNFLRPTTIASFHKTLVSGMDKVLRRYASYGTGIASWENPYGYRVFGQFGHGGQVIFADPQNEIGFAFVTKYLSLMSQEDPRFASIEKHLYTNLPSFLEKFSSSRSTVS